LGSDIDSPDLGREILIALTLSTDILIALTLSTNIENPDLSTSIESPDLGIEIRIRTANSFTTSYLRPYYA
jgi:hypothetical protein